MSVRTVAWMLADWSQRGVQLAVTAAGDLKVKAPPGVLTDEDRRLLRALKAPLVQALKGGIPRALTAATDTGSDTVCTAPGCGGVVDAYDAHARPWCARHRPKAPVAPTPEPPPWRCRCGSEVSGRLPRCPTCLRQPDGRPSPCSVCGAPVVRRPPPPRDTPLRTPRGEEPVAHGPALEPFCAVHRRGAHVLHLACARGWPAVAFPDGTTVGGGAAAWRAAVYARDRGEPQLLQWLTWLPALAPLPLPASTTGAGADGRAADADTGVGGG